MITDMHTWALQVHLHGDADEFEQVGVSLTERDGWGPYGTLVAAAFFLATDKAFQADSTSAAEVIAFVSSVRQQLDTTGSVVDPMAAERLIRAALGDGDPSDLDDQVVVATQSVLLPALAARAGVVDDPDFIAQAVKLAESWQKH